VSIIDAYKLDLSENELHARLRQASPDVVGVTVLMDKYGPSGHAVARIAKEIGAKVVMGGVYASMNAEQIAEDRNIDCIVKGEGEYLLRDILLRKTDGRILQAPRIGDLDALPRPAYDLIDWPSYAKSAARHSVDAPPLFPYGRVVTSRGCPYGCCFCQVDQISGREFRPRSAENVLDEIAWLKGTYGIRSLIFDDDNLLFDRKRAESIFRGMIDRGLTMPWVMIATAAFKLDRELIQLMAESGCVYVDVAIESGTERVLHHIIHKPVDLKYAKMVVRMLQRVGIYVAANFVIGFPTETLDEIRKSLAFAGELDADYTKIFPAIPLRHTRLWEMLQGRTEQDDFTAENLKVLRAYEWDRLNFTSEAKRKRTCERMGINETELLKMRKDTLNGIFADRRGQPDMAAVASLRPCHG
jgi:radical SAM superfamily enzyme YgiQ (UPF0313 family)